MTFPVKTMKVSGVGGLRGFNGPVQTTLRICYNTHEGFVLIQPHEDEKDRPYGGPSVEFDLTHFAEIIEAFNKQIPTDPFEAFYRNTFGPKGMMGKEYIFAYFIKEHSNKTGMMLERRSITFDGIPCRRVDQIGLTLDEFTEAYHWCKNYKGPYNFLIEPDFKEVIIPPIILESITKT